MANIDPRFYCTSDLEEYMVDNSSGLPLSGGIIYFYSDVNRTSLKPVYQLTGYPGNYTYSPLNNPCTLSSSGTFQDGLGNNIVPYYYPFTGTPEQNTGVQELYYVVVLNSGFVPQFTRQGWPQAAGAPTPPVAEDEIDNFIPNGQFLAHNNIISATEPPRVSLTFTQVSGSVPVYAQAIAQGGWNFTYSQGSTATFTNSFQTIPPSGGWGMNSFPRYAFQFVCSAIGNVPQYRDLRIIWPDVNKFSSGNPPGSTPYTLFFDAKSGDGNAYTFTLYQFYYYGTGGSPGDYYESAPIATITIGPSGSFVSHNINNIFFPANEGSIGTNNDDHCGLALRGPASGWNVVLTDFLMTEGTATFTSFPVQTNDQMLSRGVAGWMPTPDPYGNDMYLPLILTPQGMTFDHSIIGTVNAKFTTTPFNNELLCDGSAYLVGAYSAIGIPYTRLFAKFFNTSTNIYPFGSGASFSQANINSGLTTQIYLTTNQAGAVTHPADSGGGTATGFTFRSGTDGSANIGYTAYPNIGGAMTVVSNFTTATNGDALFADGPGGAATTMIFTPFDTNEGGVFFKTLITPVAASVLANTGMDGKYFTFSNASTNYYFWFYVTNEMDPAPDGKTGIQCDIDSHMGAGDVAIAIAARLNGAQIDFITCNNASTLTAGDYFTFYTNSPSPQRVVVTYQINGSSAAGPNFGAGPAYLTVNVASTDLAAAVAFKTQTAINSYQFAVPDLRGMFLRGNDPTGIWDLDVANRYAFVGAYAATNPGTYELDQVISHNHLAPSGSFLLSGSDSTYGGSSSGTTTPGTGYRGGTENRPVNISVNFFIKY